MNFNVKDMELFVANKEFIDTAIIPLIKLEGSTNRIAQSASSTEFLVSLMAIIEQQFKGRIVMFPSILYTDRLNKQDCIHNVHVELELAEFKYIFFVTTDANWTTMDEQYNIIFIPSIPLHSMDQKMKNDILRDQLRQIVPTLSQKWSL